MFANRYTALVDACVLVNVLKRNTLLTLAESDFFRVRWSSNILDETEQALNKIFTARGDEAPQEAAKRHRASMEKAFQEAQVDNFEAYKTICLGFPDPDDVHVVAAALKAKADVIVTDNVKDFPSHLMDVHSIEVRPGDHFIADTIMLDPPQAVMAIKKMRYRFKKPSLTAERLLTEMDAQGLTETVNVLSQYESFL